MFTVGLFETLPGPVQCEVLLKATEQCFNTLEKAEMLLLLLRRFPESVVQHGVRNLSPLTFNTVFNNTESFICSFVCTRIQGQFGRFPIGGGDG